MMQIFNPHISWFSMYAFIFQFYNWTINILRLNCYCCNEHTLFGDVYWFDTLFNLYTLTETAMLRVWSDILMAADRRQVTLLSLLDMSAAFDCVDHAICCSVFVLRSDCQMLSSTGSSHSCLAARSRSPMVANCQRRSTFCSAFHKAPYWDRCCTFCTQRN